MTLDSIRTVAVLGAGTMGNGIAHVFARSGYSVILRDVEAPYLDRARDTIAKNLDREIKKGKVAEADKSQILARIRAVTDMSEIARADFVVEAVPERLDLKLSVLRDADKLLRPEATSRRTPLRFRSPRWPRPPVVRTASSACTS